VFLAINLGSAAAVRADVVATFQSATSSDYVYTGGDSTTGSTFVTSPTPLAGHVLYGTSFFNPPGPYTATIALSATSHVAANAAGFQTGFDGSYTITEGSHTVTVTFTDAQLNNFGGGGASLGTTSATVTTVTANFGAAISTPFSFSVSLSGITTPQPTLGAFGFTNFAGSDTSTASASINTTSVPEPSSLVLAGVGALGMIGFGLRRRKVLGA
jgi:hypothetical protein